MTTSFTFPLEETEPEETPVLTSDPIESEVPTTELSTSFLGFGLITPFQRDRKDDFANAGSARLIKSCVTQVLLTRGANELVQGELPWRTEFGSLLHLLRHQNNDDVLEDLARVFVIDALDRWEPRVSVTDVLVERRDTSFGVNTMLLLRVRYDIIQANVPGNRVVIAGEQVEVPLSLAA